MRALYLDDLDCYLRYLDVPGREPARVYLHGLGRSSAGWFSIAGDPRLAGNRSVLLDFLGFGFSDKPAGFGYSLDDHTGTVERALDALGIRACGVVGHSLGGTIGILLAARRPDLVSVLVMAEANLDPGGGPMSQAITAQALEGYVTKGYERDLEDMRAKAHEGSDVDAAGVGMHEMASPEALYKTARSLVELTRPTTRELLMGLNIPRTFLVGERTLGSNPVSGEDAAGLDGSGVEVVVVPGAGHEMNFSQPAAVAAALARALG